MIFTEQFKGNNTLLVSCPADVNFEVYILSVGKNLILNMLKFKYPTTLEEDKQQLKSLEMSENYRINLALIHRIT